MTRTRAIKVPTVKLQQAKELQSRLAKKGIFLSLYQCLLQVEHHDTTTKDFVDPFRRMRL